MVWIKYSLAKFFNRLFQNKVKCKSFFPYGQLGLMWTYVVADFDDIRGLSLCPASSVFLSVAGYIKVESLVGRPSMDLIESAKLSK